MIMGRFDGASFVFVLLGLLLNIFAQKRNFEDYFKDCHQSERENFDNCLLKALNDVRPYFKLGLPQYNVLPFDPFYAEEVKQTMGLPNFNYMLKLKNVTESGWTISKITKLKTDFDNGRIRYTQYFPDKRLKGNYEFVAKIMGRRVTLKGKWNLNLFGFTQTTTIRRKPRMVNGRVVYDTPIKVNVEVETCERMELHISNLLGGRRFAENILDTIINAAWPPGFLLLRPIINDLVSTAFTKIFNNAFQNFPFEKIIHQ